MVPKTGGTAVRLSSPLGEESFPRFSPDGTKLAYSADYDGNIEVYVIPVAGGQPVRLTHHPMADRVLGWHPDGTRVLFASPRGSGRQRYNQFYLVGVTGGLPEKLPVPYGEFGALSPDGTRFVYMPMSQDFSNWKRYRGGWAPDIWLFDLKTFASRNITNNPANDAQPMWYHNSIYFISDRGPEQRNNIWVEDLSSGAVRQVTKFNDFDITFPSIGPDAIVFERGGRLHLLNLPSETITDVDIRVVTDRMTLRARTVAADQLVTGASVSPTGKRVAFEARGDVVTVPAEKGATINLTRSSGVAERLPQWPPVAHRGAQVMLINGWSGSGGDALPFYFRETGLGPLIGTRTWGGLIGISGTPELVDGGGVTVPTFRMFDPTGKWFAEGHGVDPDVVVDEDPTQIAKGIDPQLLRAIDEVQKRMATQPKQPSRPPYETRTPAAP
jgi:tricorn protease